MTCKNSSIPCPMCKWIIRPGNQNPRVKFLHHPNTLVLIFTGISAVLQLYLLVSKRQQDLCFGSSSSILFLIYCLHVPHLTPVCVRFLQSPRYAMRTWQPPSWASGWSLKMRQRRHPATTGPGQLLLHQFPRCLSCRRVSATLCSSARMPTLCGLLGCM